MTLNGPVELVWFDSMGAKSSSLCIRGPECTVAVDPGAASMHPSYPLSPGEKARLRAEAARRVRACLEEARVVVVTHYHWDHTVRPRDDLLPASLLRGKLVIAKNPNVFINESQWTRARAVFEAANGGPGGLYTEPQPDDVAEALGSLAEPPGGRAREWLSRLAKLWSTGAWLREGRAPGGFTLVWADGRSLEACGVKLSFTEPWFHGSEYERTGWVVALEAEVGGLRLFYTSDVEGPIVEDYAYRIIKSRPDLLVLDGPPTYLYPYRLSKRSLERAVSNAVAILEAGVDVVVYDHHVVREARWRERVRPVFEAARRLGATLATAAEHKGMRPLIDELAGGGGGIG